MTRALTLALGLLAISGALVPWAQAQAQPLDIQTEPSPPASTDDGHRLHWEAAWDERLWPELVLGGVMFGAAFGGRVGIEGTSHPRWTGAGPFDRWVDRRIGSDDRPLAKRRAATALWYLSEFWAPAVDALLVTWAGDRNPRVALHLLAMDLQALSLTGVTAVYSQLAFARSRPGRACAQRPEGCKNGGVSQSFISGHTAMAFTGASLMCLQHRHLPLYGGGWPDMLACGLGLTTATTTAMLRLTLRAHWASDVLAGALTGFAFGWLVPWAQHFRHGGGGSRRSWAFMAVPWAGRHSAGASFALRH